MIGPGRNSNSRVFWLKIDRPDTSDGSRSGVNWIRRKEQPRLRAIALASTVLPVPGHVLDEQVSATEEGHEGQADFVMLADDDAFDVGQDAVAGFLDLGHRPLSLAP